jgi:hypothetical protein
LIYPNVEVSWQVTGIRSDAWANAHPVQVEAQKSGSERGHYIHPELYGAPEESSIEWARLSTNDEGAQTNARELSQSKA